MGNGFSYFMLAFWPLLSIYFYVTKTVQVATLWTLLGGLMFLPVKTEVDLPLIPPLGKHTIPVLSALIGCWFFAKKRIGVFGNKGILRIFIWMAIISPFITVMLNKESIIVGDRIISGLDNHDALSAVVNQLLFIAPFFIGHRFFRTYNDQLLLFKTLVISGLIYSVFILVEVRLSPQFHNWFYGYFPHSFIQQKRFGGFRPVVFIGHGLDVAFFISVALIASVSLWINRAKVSQFNLKIITAYELVILFLCKSMASFLYGMFSLVALWFMSNKRILHIALLVATAALLYPVLYILELFPHEQVVELAESFDHDRAQSLVFRFKNEKNLLAHAEEKSLFGWGIWGRYRVYDNTGKDISVTDGTWIIQFGQFGWVGFTMMFGLIYLTVLKAKRAARFRLDKEKKTLLVAHTLIVAIIMFDQLPNSSLVPWYWLVIGCLYGRSENIINKKKYSYQQSMQYE